MAAMLLLALVVAPAAADDTNPPTSRLNWRPGRVSRPLAGSMMNKPAPAAASSSFEARFKSSAEETTTTSTIVQTQAEIPEPPSLVQAPALALPAAAPLKPEPADQIGPPARNNGNNDDAKANLFNCDDERAKLRSITSITDDIVAEAGAFPSECDLGGGTYAGRNFCDTTYTWKASGLCHKPLYFEQPRVERYGHAVPAPFQPLVSGAHFFVTVPLLPYKMILEPPLECVYTLGYYRPGSCAPYQVPGFPIVGGRLHDAHHRRGW